MRLKADKPFNIAQQHYKQHQEAQVLEQTNLRVDRLDFIGFPTSSTSTADNQAVTEYSKLLSRALGPYRVIKMTSHTVKIDQDRMPNRISFYHASLAPASMQTQEDMVDCKQQPPSWTTEIGTLQKFMINSARHRCGSRPHEYTVDHNVKHVGKRRQRKFFVQCYAYTSQDDRISQTYPAQLH